MSTSLLLIDTLLRGMTVGAELLIAFVFLSRRPVTWRRGLGAAFILAAACYMINTSVPLVEAVGPLIVPIGVLSIVAPVIFWWFSQSLFDDGFRLRWLTFAPLLLVAPLVIFHFTGVAGILRTAGIVLARLVMIGAFGHAIYSALRYFNDDLIEGRRRFRIIFAVAVGITGFIINYSETVGFRDRPPPWVLLFQASALLAMTMAFGVWLLSMKSEVLDGRQVEVPQAGVAPNVGGPPVRAADRPTYDRLIEVMAAGAWREESLGVAALAGKVGIPEHQLRALINGQLGFRNFSAFLSSYRLKEAKRLLADPNEARRQVLQIALDVGYGSIAPFNRAFKEATGKTPTEFRKEALSDG
jgi:AraC-like DNA-binding protein